MKKLQESVIRWGMHQVGLQTDIQSLYNCVRLKESDWSDLAKRTRDTRGESDKDSHLWGEIKWKPLTT